jgi:hypothetical protein
MLALQHAAMTQHTAQGVSKILRTGAVNIINLTTKRV